MPSARLKDTVVESSPSSWLIDAAVGFSLKLAIAESGTMVVTAALSAWPEEGSRSAGLATLVLVDGVAAARVVPLPPRAGT
jgi:hypothetical protein